MNLIEENKRIGHGLKGKRLICELAFDRYVFDQWKRYLPQNCSAWDCYPFVAAVMTVGVGVYEYEQGDYWHAFPWLSTSGHQNSWGKQFEFFLNEHESLETFKPLRELGHRFIAPILAHGGIPQYCLKDFFALLINNADYEQSSSDFIEFLSSRRSCLQNIDKPVQRFLLHGGETAEEFVARMLALWQSREEGDGGGTYGLPQRVVEAFGHWYEENSSTRKRRQRKKNFPRASVHIRPGDLDVYLYLPRCDDHPKINSNTFWKVFEKPWAVTSPHEIPLPFADKWIVEIGAEKQLLEGIVSSLPVIFFDRETGKVIYDPKHRRLPEHLWAVLPISSKTSPSPLYSEQLTAWPGYKIAVFDLSGQKNLWIEEHELEIRRPFFHYSEDPVVRECYGERKVTILYGVPQISWEGTANFTLIKNGLNQGSIDIEASDFKLWFDTPGEYRFHLRGPFGQNVCKHFLFIPGFKFQLRPEVWWPTTNNMQFEVSADGFEFLSEKGEAQPFMSTTPRLNFRAVTKSKEFHLVVEIPNLKWRFIGSDGEAAEWTNEPLDINVQDLQQINYPRLIFELVNSEVPLKMSMLGNQGSISPPTGNRSNISKEQNVWAFDLREVRNQVLQSGRAEKFDVFLEETNKRQLYRGHVLSVRPYWAINNFRAEWRKDKLHEICVTWSDHAPLVADRWLLLIPLWRPWENEIKTHHLSEHDRSPFIWRFPKLRPGRYIIRAVHAPWGCEDWLNAQFVSESKVDVYKEGWEEIFCCKDGESGIETYLECLLAHWYRSQLVKCPPQVPTDISADNIRTFLEGVERVDMLEEITIPRDRSGALNLFCLNSKATSEAISIAQRFPDIWRRILPSKEILTIELSKNDRIFVHEIAYQYIGTIPSEASREVKLKSKKRLLSVPLRTWYKQLAKSWPPADDVIFLCEKFELFAADHPVVREEYEKLKRQYQQREAI